MAGNAPRSRSDLPGRAICHMLLGTALITLNDTAMKAVVMEHPLAQSILVRGLFVLLPLSVLVYRAGGWSSVRWASFWGQALCAALLVGALLLFVTALSTLPLAICIIMIYTNPLFVAALAPFVLGERLGWQRWCAVAMGFAGTLLVFRPDSPDFTWLLLLPLGAALLSALRDLLTRRLVASESSLSILFFSSAAVTLCAAPAAAFAWTPLDLATLALLAGAALTFCFGMFYLTDSLRYGDASLVSPFKYSAVVVAIAMGYLIWDEVPSAGSLLGAALIVAGGLIVVRRQPAGDGTTSL